MVDEELLKGVHKLAQVYTVEAIVEAAKLVEGQRENHRRLITLRFQLGKWRAGVAEIELATRNYPLAMRDHWPVYARETIDMVRNVIAEMEKERKELEAGNG